MDDFYYDLDQSINASLNDKHLEECNISEKNSVMRKFFELY